MWRRKSDTKSGGFKSRQTRIFTLKWCFPSQFASWCSLKNTNNEEEEFSLKWYNWSCFSSRVCSVGWEIQHRHHSLTSSSQDPNSTSSVVHRAGTTTNPAPGFFGAFLPSRLRPPEHSWLCPGAGATQIHFPPGFAFILSPHCYFWRRNKYKPGWKRKIWGEEELDFNNWAEMKLPLLGNRKPWGCGTWGAGAELAWAELGMVGLDVFWGLSLPISTWVCPKCLFRALSTALSVAVQLLCRAEAPGLALGPD